MPNLITRKGYKLLDTSPAGAAGQALNDNFTLAGDNDQQNAADIAGLQTSKADSSALAAYVPLTGSTVITGTLGTSGAIQINRSVDSTGLQIVINGGSSSQAMGLTAQASTGTNDGKAFGIFTSGESFARSMFYTDGKFGIGSGTATRDTFISRSATNTLKISSDGGSGTGHLEVTGTIILDEVTVTPSNPSSSNQAKLYIKGDKLVISFNDAGTTRYRYIPLSGTSVTWTATTTAP